MRSTEGAPLARLVISGDADDHVLIEGAQTAELSVLDGSLYLLVSDGTLIHAQYRKEPADDVWRLRILLAGTATAQHRGPALDAYSERLELTGPDLHVFAATAEPQVIAQFRFGALKVCDLLEPARVCRLFLDGTDPEGEWIDAWDADCCDAQSGILPLRHVLAMRDALAHACYTQTGAP